MCCLDNNIRILALRTVSNISASSDDKIVDFLIFDGVLDNLKKISADFLQNDDVMSEICFCLCNIIASNQINNKIAVLKDKHIWSDILLFGIKQAKIGNTKFSNEALICI